MMRYRILRNECKEYRIEKQQFGQEWELLTTTVVTAGTAGCTKRTLEFDSYRAARDHIEELIQAPELERKRKAWSVVEEVEAPDEQENS